MTAVGRGLLVGGLMLQVLLWAPAVRGETTSGEKDAQSLFKKAEIQFGLGNYKLALDLYKMAHDLSPKPSHLFNIGQCHHRLGQFDKAIRVFELYLFQEPETDDRTDVEALIEKSRGAKRAAAAARAQPKLPVKAAAPLTPKDASPAQPGTTQKVLLWTGVGLTVALMAAGTVTGQLASDRSDAYNDPATERADLQGLKDSGETLRTVSIATFAGGGAVALGTVLYYLLGYRRADARITWAPAAGGLTVCGVF